MSSVLVVYSKLPKEQQGYLDYANGAKMTALVRYNDTSFIGVNVVESSALKIIHKEGQWCLGAYCETKKKESETVGGGREPPTETS